MADSVQAVLVRVSGRVQGVGFRDWTRREAQRLGLGGWVRNEPDGSVLAYCAGSDTAISTMLARLSAGPALAAVSKVEKLATELTDMPPDFRVLR